MTPDQFVQCVREQKSPRPSSRNAAYEAALAAFEFEAALFDLEARRPRDDHQDVPRLIAYLHRRTDSPYQR